MTVTFDGTMTALAAAAGLAAAAAAVTAIVIVPLMPLLQRYALARPNARSSHRTPTPQGGGIAIVATIVTLGGAATFLAGTGNPAGLAAILAAIVFIAAVGAWDDIRTVGVAPRLLLQTLAAAVAIAALPPTLHILPLLPWWLERALLLLGLVWFVNLTNFMDGIDWIMVAGVVPIAFGIALIGVFGALPGETVILALALGGAMLGFAPFNRPVARLFLGDVGSLPIGLLLGWLLAMTAGHGYRAAAAILPLYFVADATITLLRRVLRGEQFWQAHRSHFYQRALDGGLAVRRIVARVFAVNVALVALALVTVLAPQRIVTTLAFCVAATLVAALLYGFGRARPDAGK